MRRFTLITLIVLFGLLVVAGVYQYLAAQKDQRYPGPGPGTPFPTATTNSPSPLSSPRQPVIVALLFTAM